MSILKVLKRSLGFGGDDDDEALYADTSDKDTAINATKPATPAAAPPEELTFDPASQEIIFRTVLKVFNESLPPFLQKSVDTKAQTEYLRNALDEGVRQYLDSMARRAGTYCENRWQQTRANMSAEIDAMKAKAAEIERKSEDFKQKQLSADRQKRALSDRVHDLESQLVKLEADREQYELENRSLVNRLKVAGVQQGDIEASQAEIDRLRLELKTLRENPDEALRRETDALHTQIDEMTNGIESLKEQVRVSNDMAADLRRQLAAAERRAEEKEAKLKEVNGQLEEFMGGLDAKMNDVNDRLERSAAKLRQQKEIIARKDSEIESLRKTVADNLARQAEREKELQAQIDEMVAPSATGPVRTSASVTFEAESVSDKERKETRPIISEEDISEIEKSFESEDWFTKTPPAETPSMRGDAENPDFGYREPPRKHRPADNPSQLSLF